MQSVNEMTPEYTEGDFILHKGGQCFGRVDYSWWSSV